MQVGITIRDFPKDGGGLQVLVSRLAEHLRTRGHRARVVTRSISRTLTFQEHFSYCKDLKDRSDDDDVVVVRPWRGSKPLLWLSYKLCGRKRFMSLGISLYNLAFASSMEKALAGCDLVHHVGSGTEMLGFAGQSTARKLRIPFAASPTVHPGIWGDSALDMALYKRANRLLVYSRTERDFLMNSACNRNIDVVGCGIDSRQNGDATRFRKTHDIDGPIILFVGRKSVDKGFPILLDAFRKIKNDATLVCLGPGDAVQEDFPAGKRVCDLGFVSEDEKHNALAACDIFCVPSEGESFGIAMMEAANYRKVSICRHIHVLEELFQDSAVYVGGLEQGGHAELTSSELATGIDQLLRDPSLRQRLGDAAHTISRSFLWPKVCANYEQAYQSLVKA